MHLFAGRRRFRPRWAQNVHLFKDSIDTALVFQNLLGTFPFLMSMVPDHLNDFFPQPQPKSLRPFFARGALH
jgi:hypothetical protein